jgi:hypothetical protein
MSKFKKRQNILYGEVYDVKGFNPLTTAKSLVPEWYKKTPLLIEGTSANQLPRHQTVKGCTPFLDTLTVGYLLTTLVDIAVEQINGGPYLSWKTPTQLSDMTVVELREPGGLAKEAFPAGCSNLEFTWWTNVALKVPDGYSMLFTHPLNRHDLPFYTMSGMVDGGFPLQNGKMPFFVKEGFEGMIPRGTPFAQIIPFKMESWQMTNSETLYKESEDNHSLSQSTIVSRYKQLFWNKKYFE